MVQAAPFEQKFLDIPFSMEPITAITGTPASVLLTNVKFLTTKPDQERIGRKIFLKSLSLRLTVLYSGAELTANPALSVVVRLMIVWNKSTCGVLPTMKDVLFGVAGGGAQILGFNDLAKKGNFTVLWDKIFNICPSTLSHFAVNSFSYNDVERQFHFYKKLYIPIEFAGTAGTIADLLTNSLFFTAAVDVLGTSDVQLAGEARIRFSD